MRHLRTADLEALVTFLGDLQSVEGPVPFTTQLLDRIASLVGCEYATYATHDHARSSFPIAYVLSAAGEPFDAEEGFDAGASMFGQHQDKPGLRRVAKLSDVLPRRLRCRPDWNWNYCAPWYTVDELWIYLQPSPIEVAMIALCGRDDFGERERTIAELLQPHLVARYRAAKVRNRLRAALTALEADSGDGVVLLEQGAVAFASTSAKRLLRTYFDAKDSVPERVLQWYGSGRTQPLTVSQNGSQLVVAAANEGSALLLRERPACAGALTARENDVMRCISTGLSNAEIAGKLGVEASTVRKHLEHIYRKLGVHSRTAALAKLTGKVTS